MAQAAKGDKKTAGNSIDLVLLTKIGDSFTKKVERHHHFELVLHTFL